ncbi:Uncharacterised protein [Klebsiella pneumoniae]|nr:Uncharacterised protein [Klebsiella pneumoniae]SXT04168.1 Uncharacterised protein [Klebsiella pneumoniae]
MYHALSMKDVPDLTRMIINQHLMRSGVFQVVPLNPLSLMAILITYQH